MAKPFPSYTKCSKPSNWYRVTISGTIALAVTGLIAAIAAGLATSLLMPGVAAGLVLVCLSAIRFCRWWLNVRLICLGGDRSEIGAIYHLEPPVAGPFYAFADYDTDYSFNLLLWPFIPQDELPQSFVDQQWAPGARTQLISEWSGLFPTIPWAGEVPSQVDLIRAQQSMAGLGLGMAGQDVRQPSATDPSTDEPVPQPNTAPFQHFLMHCEIEGPGMHELLRMLYMLLAALILITAATFVPGIGWIVSAVLILLALLLAALGGNAILNDQVSPPQTGDWGGVFHSYEDAADGKSPVDIAYVVGRWVYDSFHEGGESNELHPVHFMMKMREPVTKGQIAGGDWPIDLGDQKARLDAQFQIINAPETIEIQKRPENRWKLHPLIDGCRGASAYPSPPGAVIV
ncbi:MAG: hypothetical protein ACR2FH_05390 [Caulobacteraceae bacterium]